MLDDGRKWAAAAGDRRAAEELLVTLLPRVRNLVRYLVRDDNEVDDLAQEALLVLLRNLDTYRGEGSFQTWANRVVVRAVFARKKSHSALRRQDQVTYEIQEGRGDGHGALSEEFLLRRRLVLLLDELPFPQRQVFVLHHALDMSMAEIAAELDVPIETVRSRLRHARTKLRARLDEK
jgi:RNA polymerase sigma-70 factor (ECF subfamily)